MLIERSDWRTFVLGPYDGDIADATFPCLPQVKTGRVKVFPRPSNLGPPDPNVDDTLSNVSWEDLTGGQGIAVINPASDLNRTWFSTADTRYTDGWTNPPEITSSQPGGDWDACVPLGRIGVSVYALWINFDNTDYWIYLWDPDAQTWSWTGHVIAALPTSDEAIVSFRGFTWIPQGVSGYVALSEDAPGTIAVTGFAAGATPAYNPSDPTPTGNPTPLLFGVHEQKLWAITTRGEHHTLANSLTGVDDDWFWPADTSAGTYVRLDTGVAPYQMISFPNQTGVPSLWVSTDTGLLVYDSTNTTWVESLMWNVPPHPDFGRTAAVFRPGEAIWVASGGGDLMKLTSNGVIVPASGPGGNGEGLPASRRGSVVSMATDLANLYLLLSKDNVAAGPTFRNMTLIAGTGVGWHPLWTIDAVEASTARTAIRTAYTTKADGSVDYRLFWSVGPAMYSMPVRLETYSSRQGRQAGIDRFSPTSYIDLGEFSAGAIAIEKLASHAAVMMENADEANFVTLLYRTDADAATDESLAANWHALGDAVTPNSRTVFPLGLSSDGAWSAGLPFYWIKFRLLLTGNNGEAGTETPVVRALTLTYLPLPQDAATLTFTIPLPVVVDDETDLTAEQIRDRLEGYVTSREFLQLTWQDRTYRVYAASVTSSTIAPKDAVGSLSLVLIQINTGADGLRGEVA